MDYFKKLKFQGQYLLRASMADNGIVAARAKFVTGKWNISMF